MDPHRDLKQDPLQVPPGSVRPIDCLNFMKIHINRRPYSKPTIAYNNKGRIRPSESEATKRYKAVK